MLADLSRPSLNADVLGRYYTAGWIGQALVDAIPAKSPEIILELGAGKGALSAAAVQKWYPDELITVDVDRSARGRICLPDHPKLLHTHHTHDVLDFALAERIGIQASSVDLAVCNPPYVRPRWRQSFGRILEDAGLSGCLESVHDVGADLLFIAQNLRFLRTHGKLGLILPDGLIAGSKFRGVREALVKAHTFERVIQLPRRVFASTEAQTYLVVLTKNKAQSTAIQLRAANERGHLSTPLLIDPSSAINRLDHRYYVALRKESRTNVHNRIPIGQLTESLTRGIHSSSEISSLPWPIFHLGDFPNGHSPKLHSIPRHLRINTKGLNKLPPNVRVGKPGDILIARVGRNLEQKVCMISDGHCVISDCIYRLRPMPEHRLTIFNFLTSTNGKIKLSASSHGVGAQHLSRTDLLNITI